MSLAALNLYTPMIIELLQKREQVASKLSTTTWALQLLGFVVFVVYHIRSAYPISTYLDFAALGMQSFIILGLTSFYRKRMDALVLAPILGLIAAVFAPASALQTLQLAATLLTTFALMPQIIRNFAGRTRGGWSPISAALSTAGNAVRVFTTLTLADANPLLLGQFLAGTLLNAILAVQSVVWD